MLLRQRVLHAGPDGLAVALQLAVAVVIGLLFDEPLRHHGMTGAAVGRVSSPPTAPPTAADRGEKVILVRQETSPEDVHGMQVGEGILASRGGLVSHAAVVARGWGIPAVVGAAIKIYGEASRPAT